MGGLFQFSKYEQTLARLPAAVREMSPRPGRKAKPDGAAEIKPRTNVELAFPKLYLQLTGRVSQFHGYLGTKLIFKQRAYYRALTSEGDKRKLMDVNDFQIGGYMIA